MADKKNNELSEYAIPKVNVSRATFEYLITNIMNGTWKQGEKIPSENDLRTTLNVSRHTIRQAIANLSMLGILETKRGDGNYIRQTGIGLYADFLLPYLLISRDNIWQFTEFRESIEMSASYYAALRATDEDLKLIKEKLEECRSHSHDIENYPAYDLEFHSAIAKASKNDLLIQSLNVIKKYCFESIKEYFDESLAEEGSEYHDKLYKALSDHDAEKAQHYMMLHMQNINKRVQSL